MSLHRYTPATSATDSEQMLWLDVAAGHLLAVFADRNSPIAADLATIELAAAVPDILEQVSSLDSGDTPSFALCYPVADEQDGAEAVLGVIVHGDAVVHVDGEQGRQTVRTRGFIPWAEDHVDGARQYRVGSSGDEPVGGGRLRLADGQAWAADVIGTIGAGDTDSAKQGTASGSAQRVEPQSAPAPQSWVLAEEENSADEDAAATVADHAPGESAGGAESDASPESAVGAEPGDDPDAVQDDVPSESTLIPGADGVPASGDAAGDEEDTDALQVGDSSDGEPSAEDGDFGPAEPDEQTMVRPPGGVGAIPGAAASDELGDHDGQTVLAGDVRASRDAARAASASTSDELPPTEGMPVISYVIDLPGGAVQPLDAPVIVGRAPSVSSVPASGLPHLVTVSGDDISRNHVRVAVQGDAVVVADLHSSNGTQVVLPGRPPQRLRPGEPMTVIEGTTIDLGSGVSLRVREA